MTKKRFTIEPIGIRECIVDNTTGEQLDTFDYTERLCEVLNELHEENQFLKEKEEHILYYLKEEYDYVCKRKIKYLDDVLLVKSYELIEYHIRSMIEYLVRL